MRIRVHDPALLPDLLGYLRARSGTLVARVGTDELDVALLGSYSSAWMRRELYLLVRGWEQASGGSADFSDVCAAVGPADDLPAARAPAE